MTSKQKLTLTKRKLFELTVNLFQKEHFGFNFQVDPNDDRHILMWADCYDLAMSSNPVRIVSSVLDSIFEKVGGHEGHIQKITYYVGKRQQQYLWEDWTKGCYDIHNQQIFTILSWSLEELNRGWDAQRPDSGAPGC